MTPEICSVSGCERPIRRFTVKVDNRIVLYVGDRGVSLTPKQVEYLKGRVMGRTGLRGSTDQVLADKIRGVTGWDMNRIQLFCRFAYKTKLVEL